MIYSFIGFDNPEANGREPLHGEVQFNITVPLEENRKVILRLGRKGLYDLAEVLQKLVETEREEEAAKAAKEKRRPKRKKPPTEENE